MKKKLYQQPSIKVHEVPKDALLAANSGGSNMTNVNFKDAYERNPTGSDSFEGPVINSKRGNLWGDDDQ